MISEGYRLLSEQLSPKARKRVATGGIVLGLSIAGLGGSFLNEAVSGSVGTEMAQKDPNVRPEEIARAAAGTTIFGLGTAAIGLSTAGFCVINMRRENSRKRARSST